MRSSMRRSTPDIGEVTHGSVAACTTARWLKSELRSICVALHLHRLNGRTDGDVGTPAYEVGQLGRNGDPGDVGHGEVVAGHEGLSIEDAVEISHAVERALAVPLSPLLVLVRLDVRTEP